LLSIVQMPAGVPVATVGIGNAENAGLLAVRILGASNPTLRELVSARMRDTADTVREKDAKLRDQY
jgi:5-(carboxyamino)imidazole ribonucleotide mutase